MRGFWELEMVGCVGGVGCFCSDGVLMGFGDTRVFLIIAGG